MFANLLLAVAFQVGPFYQQKSDYVAVRPFYATEAQDTDILWPLFTSHRDWWRFCLFTHYQSGENDSYQFEIMPIWYNGRTRENKSYAGLFPIYGYHPHIFLMHDVEFALWPIWMRYKMPRPSEKRMMTTNTVLFPFFSGRDDGSWSVWPFYGLGKQRESDHRYALWPLITWASYHADRDTAGEGYSWMVLPLWGEVDREREKQTLILPPFFSFARADSGTLLRAPWPIFEYESGVRRERLSIWPLYERVDWRQYGDHKRSSEVMRFGWKLVELYDDETRVFPFYASGKGYFRVWPFYESEEQGGITHGRFLALMPIRNIAQINRNFSKFWTFYEREESPIEVKHSLLWGIIRWGNVKW